MSGTGRDPELVNEDEEYSPRATPSPKSDLSCSPAGAGMSLLDEIQDAERRKEERVRQQLERAASAKSSWGSWGSVLSSVTSSITSTVSTVTSTVSTVTSTVSSLSENLADKVLDIIDDVEEKLHSGDAKPDAASAAPATTNSPSSAAAVGEGPRKPTLSEILKEAKETPVKPSTPSAGLEESDILKNVIQAIDIDTSGLKEIGSTLVETSAGVLESLGRTALSLLGDDRIAGAGSEAVAAGSSTTSSALPSMPSSPRKMEARPLSFATLFEDNMGQSHFDALQLLSRGQEKVVVSRLPGIAAAKRSKLDIDLTFIKEQLAVDEDGDREDREELDAAARVQQFSALMKQMADLTVTKSVDTQGVADARARCQECVDSWRKGEPMRDTEQEQAGDGVDPATASADGFSFGSGSSLSPILAEAAHRQALGVFAKYASQYVQVLRRAGELLLLDASSGAAASTEDLKRKASIVRDATLLVADDLVGFAEEMGGAIRNLEQSESRDKAQSVITNMFLEVGNADSTLQDAMALMAPVLQSLIFSQSS